MIEIIAAGFVGGIIRALLGFFSHRHNINFSNCFWTAIIFGLVGAVCGTAAIVLIITDAPWKIFLLSGLAGYVGTDIINSFFKLIKKRGIEL